MDGRRGILLLIDGVVNLLLGILLLSYPAGLAGALGLPPSATSFYPTLLGAVLFGIGIALFIERYSKPRGVTGLGMAGAVTINVCGSFVLLLWLILGDLEIPGRGRIALWTVALVVLLLGIAEGAMSLWREHRDGP
ncbi:MAG: hypothetical protein PVJ55_02385 [Anaerolineae bacterium]|jgi:hypothetical protein